VLEQVLRALLIIHHQRDGDPGIARPADAWWVGAVADQITLWHREPPPPKHARGWSVPAMPRIRNCERARCIGTGRRCSRAGEADQSHARGHLAWRSARESA